MYIYFNNILLAFLFSLPCAFGREKAVLNPKIAELGGKELQEEEKSGMLKREHFRQGGFYHAELQGIRTADGLRRGAGGAGGRGRADLHRAGQRLQALFRHLREPADAHAHGRTAAGFCGQRRADPLPLPEPHARLQVHLRRPHLRGQKARRAALSARHDDRRALHLQLRRHGGQRVVLGCGVHHPGQGVLRELSLPLHAQAHLHPHRREPAPGLQGHQRRRRDAALRLCHPPLF